MVARSCFLTTSSVVALEKVVRVLVAAVVPLRGPRTLRRRIANLRQYWVRVPGHYRFTMRTNVPNRRRCPGFFDLKWRVGVIG